MVSNLDFLRTPVNVQWCAGVAVAVLTMGFSSGNADEAQNSITTVAVQMMHDEMVKLKVTVSSSSNLAIAQLKNEPILRYSDPQREFPDATLWAWTVDGQPVAFSKLERLEGKILHWQYCMAVAGEERVTVRWPDGIVWKPQSAGIEFKPLAQDQQAQKTAPLRLVQMRSIVRMFRAITIDREDQSEEMRVLSQPLLRYSNAGRSVIDGAVFGLSSNGTNPDGLLLIQVRQPENQQPIWEYGCLAMTGDSVSIELDGKNVFKHARAAGPGDYGHWLWIVMAAE